MMTSSPGLIRRTNRIEYRVFAANVDDALGGLIGRSQLCGMPIANRLAQRRDARHRRVLGAIFSERLDDGALDVLGRGKIRFAGSEVRDVNALRFQLLGFLQHHHRR